MTDRPQRKPVVPLLNPAAAAPAELAENFRRVYAGALADHRSLGAGAGVYAARVVAPLVVTDDGIAFDWTDPRIYQVLADLIRGRLADDLGLVKVDEGDAADYLENQLVDYAGDTTDYVAVDIVKPGENDPLQARIAKADVRDAACESGGAGSLELAIHYKGTDSITETLSTDDWRKKVVRVWARCGDTLANLLAVANPESGVSAGLWPNQSIASALPHYALVYSPATIGPLAPVNGGAQATVTVYADVADGGRLKLQITNPLPGDYKAAWNGTTTYAASDVVASGGNYYQSKAGGNLNHPPPDVEWWDAYTMREFWFHARLDVMGTVPDEADDYATKGSAA